MGEKRRAKSKGKSVKATKHGLRPHELREKEQAFRTGAAQPIASSTDEATAKVVARRSGGHNAGGSR